MSSIQSPDTVSQLLYGNADTSEAEQEASRNIPTLPNIPRRAALPFTVTGSNTVYRTGTVPQTAGGAVLQDTQVPIVDGWAPGEIYYRDGRIGPDFIVPSSPNDIPPGYARGNPELYSQSGDPWAHFTGAQRRLMQSAGVAPPKSKAELERVMRQIQQGAQTSMDPEQQYTDPPNLYPADGQPQYDPSVMQGIPNETPQAQPDLQSLGPAQFAPRYAPTQMPVAPPAYQPMQFGGGGVMSDPMLQQMQKEAYQRSLLNASGQGRNPHRLSNFIRAISNEVLNPIAGQLNPGMRGQFQQQTNDYRQQMQLQRAAQAAAMQGNMQLAQHLMDQINANDPNSIQNQMKAMDFGLRRQAQDNSAYNNQTARFTAQSQDAQRMAQADIADRTEQRQGRLADNTIADSEAARQLNLDKFEYQKVKDFADREQAYQKMTYDLQGKLAEAQAKGNPHDAQLAIEKLKQVEAARQFDAKQKQELLAKAAQRDPKTGAIIYPELHDKQYGKAPEQPKKERSNVLADFFRGFGAAATTAPPSLAPQAQGDIPAAPRPGVPIPPDVGRALYAKFNGNRAAAIQEARRLGYAFRE